MTVPLKLLPREAVAEAVAQLGEATQARKCWGCGCLHSSLDAIERAIPPQGRPEELDAAIRAARLRLVDVKYECLGCEVCWPPLAMNALNIDGEACPSDEVEARPGWPPLPGAYTTLRYHAPVAICSLTDEELTRRLAREADGNVAMVGTLYTENLGIERIIQNVLANPNIRFLILCGPDSRQAIGHLPGQSLLALARNGVDERMRIIGAQGRRPVLKNLSRNAVEHFRRTVEVMDMVGNERVEEILRQAEGCADRYPGPAEPFAPERAVSTLTGYLPEHMVSDPNGYFVVYVDRDRGRILLEHYRNDGTLDVVVEGRSAAELYTPVVERGLISRLDHAAYLGHELARAEHALRSGEPYVQDAAPEVATACPPTSGCCAPCATGDADATGSAAAIPAAGSAGGRRRKLPRWMLPAAVFAFAATAHYAWLGFFPENGAAGAVAAECTGSACAEGEACGDGETSPVTASSMDRYIAGQSYWLGLSYGSSLAFAAAALRRYRERRLCSARNLAIGSVSISGVFAVLGCYLLGCCGSPMLGVYLSLFGAAFLPLAKPLVALLTIVSLGAAWWWMKRRERFVVVAAPARLRTHVRSECG